MSNDHCVSEECTMGLGPDALEFTHKGEPAGYLCEKCIANIPALRVLFKSEKGAFMATAVTFLEKPID